MDAKSLIKKFEGFKNTAYKCPAGKWTIGYGFTYNPFTFEQVNKGHTITQRDADAWLEKVCNSIRNDIRAMIGGLNINQTEALISFIFNIGIQNFQKSTMYKLLSEKEFDKASKQFDRWVTAKVGKERVTLKGLVKRRQAEKDLFMQTTSASS